MQLLQQEGKKERKKRRGGLLYHVMHDWRLKRTRLWKACGRERTEVENDTWKKRKKEINSFGCHWAIRILCSS